MARFQSAILIHGSLYGVDASVSFNASASTDSEGDIAAYTYSVVVGSVLGRYAGANVDGSSMSWAAQAPTDPTATLYGLHAGTVLTVSLVVTDGDSNGGHTGCVVTVNAIPVPVVTTSDHVFLPSSGFVASAMDSYDADGSIVSRTWGMDYINRDRGAATDLVHSTAAGNSSINITNIVGRAIIILSLTVCDNDGGCDTTTFRVAFEDATLAVLDVTAVTLVSSPAWDGMTWAAFSGAGSIATDTACVIVAYWWSVHSDSDGRTDGELTSAMLDTATGPVVNVTGGYRAGTYTLTLFVMDSTNATVSTTATITVLLVAQAGNVGGVSGPSYPIVVPSTATVLTAASSLLYAATPVSYAWAVIAQPEPALVLEGVDCGPRVSPAASSGSAPETTLSGLCTVGWYTVLLNVTVRDATTGGVAWATATIRVKR